MLGTNAKLFVCATLCTLASVTRLAAYEGAVIKVSHALINNATPCSILVFHLVHTDTNASITLPSGRECSFFNLMQTQYTAAHRFFVERGIDILQPSKIQRPTIAILLEIDTRQQHAAALVLQHDSQNARRHAERIVAERQDFFLGLATYVGIDQLGTATLQSFDIRQPADLYLTRSATLITAARQALLNPDNHIPPALALRIDQENAARLQLADEQTSLAQWLQARREQIEQMLNTIGTLTDSTALLEQVRADVQHRQEQIEQTFCLWSAKCGLPLERIPVRCMPLILPHLQTMTPQQLNVAIDELLKFPGIYTDLNLLIQALQQSREKQMVIIPTGGAHAKNIMRWLSLLPNTRITEDEQILLGGREGRIETDNLTRSLAAVLPQTCQDNPSPTGCWQTVCNAVTTTYSWLRPKRAAPRTQEQSATPPQASPVRRQSDFETQLQAGLRRKRKAGQGLFGP